ncbi:MobF family relaxase [Pelagibacterium luteolum]|uniref:Conjugative relaxase domain-containing protein, TrwC/TraI family n=1 Tax=Pelagibacterium luteolum TaxID=440168 RepID=A0A1G7Y2F3_9HYPH|nr:MobF family relaxase [Pelagibacterium luteolum]SDG90567.1 conjugative relaxase domain-containing protein, TrwC/TraI family [Pelagibacterium luteolum]
MVATWNPAADAGYYIHAQYYLETGEPAGVWYAPTGRFGLVDRAHVVAALFERLFRAHDENGRTLLAKGASRLDRTGAFDITFSAPKSVSLAGTLADVLIQRAIGEAHDKAVRAALNLLNEEAAWARRGRGGNRIERVELTAACFRHHSSRAAEHSDGAVFEDPNIHTHCVVFNLAQRADGTTGALHSTILRDWKMAAGATYHAALAEGLMQAGFAIDRIGKNGMFEIADVSDEATRYFSARRDTITAELHKAGTTSAQSVAHAAQVARSSRRAKSPPQDDVRTIWQEAARRNNFDIARAISRQRTPMTALKARAEKLFASRLKDIPHALTQSQSLFERRELMRAIAESLVGTGLGSEQIAPALSELLRAGGIVQLGRDVLGTPRYTTPEMIALEQDVVAIATRLLSRPVFVPDKRSIDAALAETTLSQEQIDAVHAATGSRRLVIVEGAPGVGKTTILRPVVAALQSAGYQAIGAASAWKIANALRDDLGIEARANASLLKSFERGRPVLDSRSVLIVDEAGLLSSREMHAMLMAVERANARLILVGDRQQLQPIGAGSGLSLVAQTAGSSYIRNIVRQSEAWMRNAVVAVGFGDPQPALQAFRDHGRLVEGEGFSDAISKVIDQLEPELLSERADSILMIARTNSEAEALCIEARSRLRKAGLLAIEDIGVTATTPSGRTTKLALAVGDRIRFLVRNDELGVINGSVGVVLAVEAARCEAEYHARITAQVGCEQIAFDTRDIADEKGRARLAWGYATTVYGAQGLTVDKAAVLLTPEFDRHHAYVAISRSRGATILITDRQALDQSICESDTQNPTDPIGSKQRDAYLARRLAASHLKQTTIEAALAINPDRGREHRLFEGREVGHGL